MRRAELILKSFPSDNQNWQVIWFGGLDLDPSNPKEPLIQTMICSENNDRETILFGVGKLPAVHIGSIWKNGRFIGIAKTERQSVNVKFSSETLQIINSGKKEDNNTKYVIDPFSYPINSSDGLYARCLCIAINGDPYGIIIPIIEVIRFYYFQTSDLARILFNGDFFQSPNILYDEQQNWITKDGKTCQLSLTKNFNDEDGWIAARIAFDEIALKNAKHIWLSISKNFQNDRSAYPETYPPFVGNTRLSLRGKLLLHRKRFLATRIESCSGRFPFRELIVDRKNSNIRPEIDTQDRKVSNWLKCSRKDAKSGYELIDTEAPDSQIMKFSMQLAPNKRFTDILDKEIKKPTKLTSEFRAGDKVRTLSITADAYSTGEQMHTGLNIGQINLVSQSRPDKGEAPLSIYTNFIMGLDSLKERYNVDSVLLKPSDGFPSFSFPIRDHERRLIKWSFINYKAKTRRKVLIAELFYDNNLFYLMEIEKRQSEKYTILFLHDLFFNKLSMNKLDEVLLNSAISRGVWLSKGQLLNTRSKQFKHTWSSYEKFAEAIFKEIQKSTKDVSISR